MRKIITITALLMLYTSLNAQTEILNKAINELTTLKVSEYKDDRNKPLIEKIRKSTELIHSLKNENRFDVAFFDSDQVIVNSNIKLVLNENENGFYLQVPDKLLSEKYYDLLLTTLAKHFVQVYNIFTITNYYEIYNKNILERLLYDMDNTYTEYVLLTEYIDQKYPINSKWCKKVVESQNDNNLSDISKGLYFVDNKIVYKIYGLFKKYSENGDISYLDETWEYINKISNDNKSDNVKSQINLNSIAFTIHYLNYTEIAVIFNSELKEDGSRDMSVINIAPHTEKISKIKTYVDSLKKELDSDLLGKDYKKFEAEYLIQQ